MPLDIEAYSCRLGENLKIPILIMKSYEGGGRMIGYFWSSPVPLGQFRRNQLIQHCTGV